MKFERIKFRVVLVTRFVPGNAKSQESVLCMLISGIRITKRAYICCGSERLNGTSAVRVSALCKLHTAVIGAYNHMRVMMHNTGQTQTGFKNRSLSRRDEGG